MAVQELGIPSGFDADLESLSVYDVIKKVETQDRKVILYFDEVGFRLFDVVVAIYLLLQQS